MNASHGCWLPVADCRDDLTNGSLRTKRGQVTIFIIFGILVIVGILALFFLMGDGGEILAPSDLGPRDSVRDCVEDVVEESVVRILENGGERSPSHAVLYEGREWNYLCYQQEYYIGCHNIHPMLEIQIEREIERDSATGIQGCFDVMKDDFEGRGFEVSGGSTEYFVDLVSGHIDINLKKKIDIDGESGANSFENFNTGISSSIYKLVQVVRRIVDSESQFCDFEYNAYMLLYPEYDIKRTDYRENKIYSVSDRLSGEEFKFAIRSCAFPPGV